MLVSNRFQAVRLKIIQIHKIQKPFKLQQWSPILRLKLAIIDFTIFARTKLPCLRSRNTSHHNRDGSEPIINGSMNKNGWIIFASTGLANPVFWFSIFSMVPNPGPQPQAPAPSSWFPGSSVSFTWPTLKRRRGFGTGTSELDEAQPGDRCLRLDHQEKRWLNDIAWLFNGDIISYIHFGCVWKMGYCPKYLC